MLASRVARVVGVPEGRRREIPTWWCLRGHCSRLQELERGHLHIGGRRGMGRAGGGAGMQTLEPSVLGGRSQHGQRSAPGAQNCRLTQLGESAPLRGRTGLLLGTVEEEVYCR